MRKKSRLYIGIGVVIIITLGLCYQYYRINLGVPRKFNMDKYTMEEVLKLDDFEITINNIKKGENSGDPNSKFAQDIYNLYEIDLNIKNVSSEDKPIKTFYTKSLLLNGNYMSEIPTELGSEEMDIVLKSQEEKNIKLTYNLSIADESLPFEFYPPRELYTSDIKKDLEDLKMCQKYIELYMNK